MTTTAASSFFVRGVPAPKGSKRAFAKNGRAFVVDDAPKTLKAWESAVRFVLQNEWRGPPLEGAVRVELTFCFLRPPSVPKRRTFPAVRPDADKIARACLDPMTGIAFRDDAQVCELNIRKRYAQEPGVLVLIETMEQREGHRDGQ